MQAIKDKILGLEDDYTEISKELGKSWAPYSTIEKLRQIIAEAEGEETLRDALETIEFGFSNPMNVKQCEGVSTSHSMEVDNDSGSNMSGKEPNNKKVIENGLVFFRNNRKIKKFWATDALRDSWKEYNSNIKNGSISALFLSVCIFSDQAEEFVDKISLKLEKRKKFEEKKSKDKTCKKNSIEDDRNDRKRRAGFYKEESSEGESESDSKPKNKRIKVKNDSEFDDESEEESDEVEEEEAEEEEEIDDEDSQWDSK